MKRVVYDIRNAIYGLCVAAVALCVLSGCAREAPVEISVNAKSAIIVDIGSGEVLFEKNAEARFPPASTAKVMTAVVAIENSSLRKRIVPSHKAVKAMPTTAGLKPGVKYRLKDLLAAILIMSANDAAFAIAEGVAGSEKEFARLMNRKAREIGMTDTYFANASGLPTGKRDRQYTTSRDLAKMMGYALRYRIIPELMSKKSFVIRGSDGKKIHLKTHNKSLLLFSRAPWGKTGYTREARRTFVGMNPSRRPCIVFALLKSNDLWNDIMTLGNRGMEVYLRRRWGPIYRLLKWVQEERARARTHLVPFGNLRLQVLQS